MIKQQTVFVLGAGASYPYEFPLGLQLVDRLCGELNSANTDTEFMRRLIETGLDAGRINQFVNALRGARPYSVDAFLELRPEFLPVGKAVIADVLLRAEHRSNVLTASADSDWYRYLLSRVLLLRNEEYYRAQARKLTIVTFNFDRSFEWALFAGIRDTLGVQSEQARQLATELQVHHVHGQLGEAAWLNPTSRIATQFGDVSLSSRRIATEDIKIVSEEIDPAVLEDIGVALNKATRIYFIGFGFDDRNLVKLGTPDSVEKAITIRGTALGMTNIERSPTARHFERRARTIELYDVDAMRFIREYADALFE